MSSWGACSARSLVDKTPSSLSSIAEASIFTTTSVGSDKTKFGLLTFSGGTSKDSHRQSSHFLCWHGCGAEAKQTSDVPGFHTLMPFISFSTDQEETVERHLPQHVFSILVSSSVRSSTTMEGLPVMTAAVACLLLLIDQQTYLLLLLFWKLQIVHRETHRLEVCMLVFWHMRQAC